MTPVAGGVADGEKDGPILGCGLQEWLLAPGVPLHRIMGMLQKVGTLLRNQAVRIAQGFNPSLAEISCRQHTVEGDREPIVAKRAMQCIPWPGMILIFRLKKTINLSEIYDIFNKVYFDYQNTINKIGDEKA
jgi:hypothetical protein